MFRKEAKEYQHNNNLTELSADHIVAIKEILSKKLHVEGNIWYISRSLSKLKSVNCVVENEIENELRRMECEFSDKILDLDRCRVLKFNIHEIFKYKFLNIFNKFKNYINELRAELYPVGEVQKNLIGLQSCLIVSVGICHHTWFCVCVESSPLLCGSFSSVPC